MVNKSNASAEGSFVQDAASVVGSRFQEVVTHIKKPETRAQIQAKVDFVVKLILSPCVGAVGGVPFKDVGGGWSKDGDEMMLNVPAEVSPNTSEENMKPPSATATLQQFTLDSAFPESHMEGKKARSLAKLKRLGARHQLASGHVSPSLPDAARPVSPDTQHDVVMSKGSAGKNVSDEVDFDDGISALSAHTLEEMDKRFKNHEKKNTYIVNSKQFSVSNPKKPSPAAFNETVSGDTGDVFGEPFFNQVKTPPKLGRVGTNDSQRLEKAWSLNEVNYWNDEVKKDNDKRSTRREQRLSVEERARRLRDLSRSRSRSSGTGSMNSGLHPHETSGLVSKIRVQVSRDSDVCEDPFSLLEIGEI